MPASWPEEAETHRELAIKCAQRAAEFATDARQYGDRRRELVAVCDAELTNILISLEKSKQTKLSRRQWPQFAKVRRDMSTEHTEIARSKLADVAGADDALQRALLAEVAALCADVVLILTRVA